MKKYLSLVLFLPLSLSANNGMIEESHEQEEPVFYCTANNGKLIELSKYREVYTYRFGADLNKPELTLENHIEDVRRVSEVVNGVESKRFYDLKSGNYTYRVFSSNPKNYQGNGVEVFKNKKSIARIECAGDIHIFD
ncbi:hypothetical protein [Pasteurella sp. PK-2025]|uniref:hypothetical protein n=1 Tax=unclassified Pasteurella TaxID=2621516 RepID=UPI003C7485DD